MEKVVSISLGPESVEDIVKLGSDFGCEIDTSQNFMLVKKWGWNYEDFLSFQEIARNYVEKHRNYKIYIFANHPHVFTYGRGVERGQKDLIEFDPGEASKLCFPFHKIHRGGGLTFHYPGQWIFYPIVSINNRYSLEDHMCWCLKSVKEVLEKDFKIDNIITAKKLMGVWRKKKKLASIGVGLKRYVTLHGIALNLISDKKMSDVLKDFHPCGMSSDTYTSVDNVKELSGQDGEGTIEYFHQLFLKRHIK